MSTTFCVRENRGMVSFAFSRMSSTTGSMTLGDGLRKSQGSFVKRHTRESDSNPERVVPCYVMMATAIRHTHMHTIDRNEFWPSFYAARHKKASRTARFLFPVERQDQVIQTHRLFLLATKEVPWARKWLRCCSI